MDNFRDSDLQLSTSATIFRGLLIGYGHIRWRRGVCRTFGVVSVAVAARMVVVVVDARRYRYQLMAAVNPLLYSGVSRANNIDPSHILDCGEETLTTLMLRDES